MYVFQPASAAVAPTGLTEVRESDAVPGGGFMSATFVNQAIYFFPSVDTQPFRSPVVVLAGDAGPVLDVVQKESGEIYFATPAAVWQLLLPLRGDADGDRTVSQADFAALARQVITHPSSDPLTTTWGSDVNGDGVVDARDLVALARLLKPRSRIVGR